MGSAVEQPGQQAGAEGSLPGVTIKADRREQTRLPVRSKKGRKRARTGTTGKRRARASRLVVLHANLKPPRCRFRNSIPASDTQTYVAGEAGRGAALLMSGHRTATGAAAAWNRACSTCGNAVPASPPQVSKDRWGAGAHGSAAAGTGHVADERVEYYEAEHGTKTRQRTAQES